jgi:hypothetical protein
MDEFRKLRYVLILSQRMCVRLRKKAVALETSSCVCSVVYVCLIRWKEPFYLPAMCYNMILVPNIFNFCRINMVDSFTACWLVQADPVSTGNMFQDLPRLCETADNTERYI